MDDLWCVHVLGPDSILPTKDQEEARRRAAEINGSLPADSGGMLFRAVVKRWPFASHAHKTALKKVDWTDIC